MTFTYTPAAVTDITRVRFWLGDTESAAAIFTDEEITMMISEEGDWQHAVIACIRSIIARISATPDFTADWLKVDQSRALKGYERLLTEMQKKFGIPALSASSQAVYRSDSLQTEPPEDW